MIAERQRLLTDNLSGLMALAGDEQRIAGLKRGNAGLDGFGTVADISRALGCSEDGSAYRRRIFAARIVVGDDDAVGVFARDRTHQRALAGVTIAAGAEHHDEL